MTSENVLQALATRLQTEGMSEQRITIFVNNARADLDTFSEGRSEVYLENQSLVLPKEVLLMHTKIRLRKTRIEKLLPNLNQEIGRKRMSTSKKFH